MCDAGVSVLAAALCPHHVGCWRSAVEAPGQPTPKNTPRFRAAALCIECACLAALCRRLACSTSPASLLPPRNQRRQLARQQHLRLLAATACPRRHQPSPAQPQASEWWSRRQAQAQRQVWWLQLILMRQGRAHGGGGQQPRKTEQHMHAQAGRGPVALAVAGRVYQQLCGKSNMCGAIGLWAEQQAQSFARTGMQEPARAPSQRSSY